jgi:hypothetical protein
LEEEMPKSQVIEKPKDEETTPDLSGCQHHWVIASPRGALSEGRCKRCGEEREFRNSTGDYVWDEKDGGGGSPWRGIRSTPKRTADGEEIAA